MGNGRTPGYPNLGTIFALVWGNVCDGHHSVFVTKKIHASTRRPYGTQTQSPQIGLISNFMPGLKRYRENLGAVNPRPSLRDRTGHAPVFLFSSVAERNGARPVCPHISVPTFPEVIARTISFSGSGRMDNLLKDHSYPNLGRFSHWFGGMSVMAVTVGL
jgi:hypothetical protein